ncbi:DUF983 domain-containing protein [Compostibacter hankyongensis]|uniref:DUF983 domain-containing protein n=1 Tax=Compostibacter hankyongensis TaxID=1007089 RepID=A0ABP8G882_9BACT
MKSRSLLASLFTYKCPRCRRGNMFTDPNPYHLRKMFSMPKHCPECGQRYELEVGFWYGTGYVSYGLTVALSVFNLAWYWLIFGISVGDNSIYWWLLVNALILLVAMPWLIRFSRVMYLYFFVRYDPETEQLPRSDKTSPAS